jgi:hypothetical protein
MTNSEKSKVNEMLIEVIKDEETKLKALLSV